MSGQQIAPAAPGDAPRQGWSRPGSRPLYRQSRRPWPRSFRHRSNFAAGARHPQPAPGSRRATAADLHAGRSADGEAPGRRRGPGLAHSLPAVGHSAGEPLAANGPHVCAVDSDSRRVAAGPGAPRLADPAAARRFAAAPGAVHLVRRRPDPATAASPTPTLTCAWSGSWICTPAATGSMPACCGSIRPRATSSTGPGFWTRCFWAGAWLLEPFYGFRMGLHLWGVLISPVLLALALFALDWATIPILGRDARLFACLAFLLQPSIQAYTMRRPAGPSQPAAGAVRGPARADLPSAASTGAAAERWSPARSPRSASGSAPRPCLRSP